MMHIASSHIVIVDSLSRGQAPCERPAVAPVGGGPDKPLTGSSGGGRRTGSEADAPLQRRQIRDGAWRGGVWTHVRGVGCNRLVGVAPEADVGAAPETRRSCVWQSAAEREAVDVDRSPQIRRSWGADWRVPAIASTWLMSDALCARNSASRCAKKSFRPPPPPASRASS
jgi:hypothetical protein